MKKPPKQTKCGCGKPSIMCMHGSDGAWWMCKACYDELLKRLGRSA